MRFRPAQRKARRRVGRLALRFLLLTPPGRMYVRRRLLRHRYALMRVIAATTVGGMVILTLMAERERVRRR